MSVFTDDTSCDRLDTDNVITFYISAAVSFVVDIYLFTKNNVIEIMDITSLIIFFSHSWHYYFVIHDQYS